MASYLSRNLGEKFQFLLFETAAVPINFNIVNAHGESENEAESYDQSFHI